LRDKVFLYGSDSPSGKALGTWPRLDGAPSPCRPGEKSYDKKRKAMAHFVGMDFLFTRREYCQSISTDSQGRKVLVNSDKNGVVLAVKPVPDRFLEKPWFSRRIRYPRAYLGITRIDERIKKLSWLVHLLTTYGFHSRRFLKDVTRLSIVWWKTSFDDMRKHVNYLTREVERSLGRKLATRRCRKNPADLIPRFRGEITHENGMKVPLWNCPFDKRKEIVLP